jgi:hypothetical protein
MATTSTTPDRVSVPVYMAPDLHALVRRLAFDLDLSIAEVGRRAFAAVVADPSLLER